MALVMAVDDHAEILKVLQHIVRKAGGDYCAATTPEQALALAEAHQPDIVLMDLALKGHTDGLELTRRICAMNPDTIVIAITADRAAYSQSAAIAAGCVDYIEKPFQVRPFIDTMQHYLSVV